MTYAQSMQCPQCRSRYTQSVKIAYLQSVRISGNGYQSISEFGKNLEPPPPRSEFGPFFVVAILVTSAAMLLLPSLSELVDIKWLSGVSSFDWPVVVASVVLGLIRYGPSTSRQTNDMSNLLDQRSLFSDYGR